ncbi:LysR family transcriptional regulator [Niveispirillum sp. KHB5.9]|uniref:LysR family transcriptional regulator n=1 Tax=Niveispirillum sp. KHB5.9 TaxID=3400269 RepID=UPI003A843101
MKPHSLSDLDAFLAVARHRNFRRAARERGVSASTLSQAVRDLEEATGMRLLHRTTRSVTPTEAGQRLVDSLTPAMAAVTQALDGLDQYRGTAFGTLRLNVPGIVARVVLPDILGPFLAAHPGVRVEVEEENAFVDVFAAGFDAGVRYEEALAQDVVAVPMGPRVQRYLLAASPAHIAQHGLPQHPTDLLSRPCLRQSFPGGALLPWEFECDGEGVKLNPSGPLVASNSHLLTGAAMDGLGWIYTFAELLAPHIAAGELVEALPDWSLRFSGPYLYYSSRRHVPGPLRALVEWLRNR